MERQMQQLSLNDNSSVESKENQKSSISTKKFGKMFQETRALLAKRINELEIHYKKLSEKRNNLNTENNLPIEYIRTDLKMKEVTDQLNIMLELNKVHLSDMKKIVQARNKQKKGRKWNFFKRMEDFQRYKELLSLLQYAEVREAFRTETKGAIKLTNDELEYLYWLNAEINPSINSVENMGIWRKKLRESTAKAVEITLGSNKKITNSWTGYDTKCLLERISRCEFFKGRTMWVNMEIFNRINASIFSNAFETYSYEYYDNQEILSDASVESSPDITPKAKISKCKDQSFNIDSATGSNVKQNHIRVGKKASNVVEKTKENYKFVKRSDKPDDYYLCFNYYPARFIADVKVPSSLARRPPPGIFRCDI